MLVIILIFAVTCGVPKTTCASQLSEIQVKRTIPIYPSNQKDRLAFGAYSIPTYPEYTPENFYPTSKTNDGADSNSTGIRQASLETWPSIIAKGLVPLSSYALYMGAKAIAYVFKFMAIAFISVALTTCICTFTPLCHITFDGITHNNTHIADIRKPYNTSDILEEGTAMIGHTIDAFKQIQRDIDKNVETQITESKKVASMMTAMNRRRRRNA